MERREVTQHRMHLDVRISNKGAVAFIFEDRCCLCQAGILHSRKFI